jgi:hypothetical protein
LNGRVGFGDALFAAGIFNHEARPSPTILFSAQRLAAQSLGRLRIAIYHFNRKIEMQFKRFLAEPWPCRLQPLVGQAIFYFYK